ncbi:MFS transporter [Myxococcota bacterium]|nr:MFS transporter [Myxococcota bacterium]
MVTNPPGTFSALKFPEFRALWFGSLLSFVAFFMSTIVQSVVAFEVGGTNSAVGKIVSGQGIAMLLIGPLGGAIADRWPKRRVIVFGQALAAGVFLWTGLLIASGAMTIVWLAISAFSIGVSIAFIGPSRQGMTVELVPATMRGNAMAINNVANTGARVMGPAVAGILLAWESSGPAGSYLIMTLCYLAATVFMAWVPRIEVQPEARSRPVLRDIAEGLSYVFSHKRLRLLVLFFTISIFMGFPHVTVLPGLAENALGGTAVDISELFLASAVGALAASLAVTRFGDSPHADIIYTGMAGLFGVSLLGLAWSPSFFWAQLSMFGVGAGSGGFQALNASVIARETALPYIGRVMSLVMLAFGGFGLMALPYGYLADWAGERNTIVVMGCSVLLVTAVFRFLLVRESADRESAPLPAEPLDS